MPTLVRVGPYRFYIVQADCAERMHVHADGEAGTAKLWLEPEVALASSAGYTPRQLRPGSRRSSAQVLDS